MYRGYAEGAFATKWAVILSGALTNTHNTLENGQQALALILPYRVAD